MRKKFLFQSFSIFLASLYLATNCAFAHKPQTSMWEERRVALATPSIFDSRFSAVARHNLKLDPGLKHSRMTNILPYGSIRKILNPQASNSQTIIHIQDVHGNLEAQRNIAAAVRALVNSKDVGAVALEGAFGPVDLTAFHRFPHPPSVKKAADALLLQNKISGPIYSLLTESQAAPFIVGIDDISHYRANVASYRQSAPLVKNAKALLEKQRRDLLERKKSVFNASLLAFDEKVNAYRGGTVPMGAYIKELEAAAGSGFYPMAYNFLSAVQLESSLNFTRVESERALLLHRLLLKLSKTQSEELASAGAAFRAGNLRHADFYAYLTQMCHQQGISLASFPWLEKYLEYVRLTDRIDAETLFRDITTLENDAYALLAKTPAERELIQQSKQLYLTGKLVEFALTKEEWNEYKSASRLEFETGNLEFFKNFYREAEIRDERMAVNLLAETRDHRFQTLNSKLIVLVTGGFHSSGIDQRLAAAGHTVVTFVPKISKVDTENGSAYLSAFTQEKTPLDKLFEGQKLFLSKPQWGLPQMREMALLSTGAALLANAVPSATLESWFSSVWHATSVHLSVVGNESVKAVIDGVSLFVQFPAASLPQALPVTTLASTNALLFAEIDAIPAIVGSSLSPVMMVGFLIAATVLILRASYPPHSRLHWPSWHVLWAKAGSWRSRMPHMDPFIVMIAAAFVTAVTFVVTKNALAAFVPLAVLLVMGSQYGLTRLSGKSGVFAMLRSGTLKIIIIAILTFGAALLTASYQGGWFKHHTWFTPRFSEAMLRQMDAHVMPEEEERALWEEIRGVILHDMNQTPFVQSAWESFGKENPDKIEKALFLLSRIKTGKESTRLDRDEGKNAAELFPKHARFFKRYLEVRDAVNRQDYNPALLERMSAMTAMETQSHLSWVLPALEKGFKKRWDDEPGLRERDFYSLSFAAHVSFRQSGPRRVTYQGVTTDVAVPALFFIPSVEARRQKEREVRQSLLKNDELKLDPNKTEALFNLPPDDYGYVMFEWYRDDGIAINKARTSVLKAFLSRMENLPVPVSGVVEYLKRLATAELKRREGKQPATTGTGVRANDLGLAILLPLWAVSTGNFAFLLAAGVAVFLIGVLGMSSIPWKNYFHYFKRTSKPAAAKKTKPWRIWIVLPTARMLFVPFVTTLAAHAAGHLLDIKPWGIVYPEAVGFFIGLIAIFIWAAATKTAQPIELKTESKAFLRNLFAFLGAHKRFWFLVPLLAVFLAVVQFSPDASPRLSTTTIQQIDEQVKLAPDEQALWHKIRSAVVLEILKAPSAPRAWMSFSEDTDQTRRALGLLKRMTDEERIDPYSDLIESYLGGFGRPQDIIAAFPRQAVRFENFLAARLALQRKRLDSALLHRVSEMVDWEFLLIAPDLQALMEETGPARVQAAFQDLLLPVLRRYWRVGPDAVSRPAYLFTFQGTSVKSTFPLWLYTPAHEAYTANLAAVNRKYGLQSQGQFKPVTIELVKTWLPIATQKELLYINMNRASDVLALETRIFSDVPSDVLTNFMSRIEPKEYTSENMVKHAKKELEHRRALRRPVGGGSWSDNWIYMIFGAWLIEPGLAYLFGYGVAYGTRSLLALTGVVPVEPAHVISAIVGMVGAFLVYWGPHTYRGPALLRRPTVIGLGLAYALIGYPFFRLDPAFFTAPVFTGSLIIALVALAAATIYHVVLNVIEADERRVERVPEFELQRFNLQWIASTALGANVSVNPAALANGSDDLNFHLTDWNNHGVDIPNKTALIPTGGNNVPAGSLEFIRAYRYKFPTSPVVIAVNAKNKEAYRKAVGSMAKISFIETKRGDQILTDSGRSLSVESLRHVLAYPQFNSVQPVVIVPPTVDSFADGSYSDFVDAAKDWIGLETWTRGIRKVIPTIREVQSKT